MPNAEQMFRFDVAFSFAGPHREKVREIVDLVAKKIGKDRVFFDEWYEHEILGDDMDVLLQRLYHKQSLFVLADLSDDYAGRPWCQAEARAIRALRFEIDSARDETQRLRLLNARFGPGEVPGVFKPTGYLDATKKTSQQCADVILKRLELLRERLRERVPEGSANSPRLRPEELAQNLIGNDPVLGNEAVEELGRMGGAAFPYLKELVLKCGGNEYLRLQPAARIPKVFSLIGDASVEILTEIIKEGGWASRLAASRCFYGLSRFPAANELAKLLESWNHPDIARCAIEGLGWLGCWQWNHLIEESAFDSTDYAREKLSRYAFRASVLMLALQTDRSIVDLDLKRVERVLGRWQKTERPSDDDVLSDWKSLSNYFRSTATEAVQSWVHARPELFGRFAIEVFRARRSPASIGYLTVLANDKRLSPETFWRAYDSLGEIGTKEACSAIIDLMDSEVHETGTANTWLLGAPALSKMYHHLDDQQYEKYGTKILLSDFHRMNTYYTNLRRVSRVSGIEKLLDSRDEWIRRPAAVCLGIMEGSHATPKLKQYLRHAPSAMDALFILGGLLRSGALEYYSKYCEKLGEALSFQTINSLDYLWKRELVALLATDPNAGEENSKAWAEIFFVDADECIDEVAQILPSHLRHPR